MIDRHIINTALWTFEDGGNLWLSLRRTPPLSHLSRWEMRERFTIGWRRFEPPQTSQSSTEMKGLLYDFSNSKTNTSSTAPHSTQAFRCRKHFWILNSTFSMTRLTKRTNRERPNHKWSHRICHTFRSVAPLFSIAGCIDVSCDDGENCNSLTRQSPNNLSLIIQIHSKRFIVHRA